MFSGASSTTTTCAVRARSSRGGSAGEVLRSVPGTGMATDARVSVVVPVLDEEAAIDRRPAQLRRAGGAGVIVGDGGSRDKTVERAEAHGGVRVVRTEKGRARQMNAGAREAGGDVLLFLHADTTLPAGAID